MQHPQRTLPGAGTRRNTARGNPGTAPAEDAGTRYAPSGRLPRLAQHPGERLQRRTRQIVELPRLPIRPHPRVEPAAVREHLPRIAGQLGRRAARTVFEHRPSRRRDSPQLRRPHRRLRLQKTCGKPQQLGRSPRPKVGQQLPCLSLDGPGKPLVDGCHPEGRLKRHSVLRVRLAIQAQPGRERAQLVGRPSRVAAAAMLRHTLDAGAASLHAGRLGVVDVRGSEIILSPPL